MDNSEDDVEEDETEWKSSFVDSVSSDSSVPGPKTKLTPVNRVILHFDLDCFYAQVEMIRNPALKDVPLGIQQKYIIVTCNYVARERGVTKLMSVTGAMEKCPELVLVKGEDLTHYREMSYKVTELLMSHCRLVERLGFDENFVDVTEMVEHRLAQTVDPDSISFKGHVYNDVSADVKAADHARLALGSHIAAEFREAIHSKLGLTGCAGIAINKLLAKLVSGTFKPNQQTVLLPESVGDIMGSLSSLRKVPGVGHQTAKRLQTLGLVSLNDLQLFPLNDLVSEFGASSARRLKNLALGVDDSPVTPSGAPQSLSDEDSFKKMSSTTEALEKIHELLCSLVERMHKDGRQPQTFRLTVRKYSATNKWFNRESRQCPIPIHVGQKITSGSIEDAVVQLVPLAMKLFHKMVNSSVPFHLTLINVCFSNLQTRGAAIGGKGTITSFFTLNSSPRKTQSQDESSQNPTSLCLDPEGSTCSINSPHKTHVTTSSSSCSKASLHGFTCKTSSVAVEENPKASCSTSGCKTNETNMTGSHQFPPNVDPEVFKLLPEDIQKELLSPAYLISLPDVPVSPLAAHEPFISEIKPSQPFTDSQHIKEIKEATKKLDISHRASTVTHQWPLSTEERVSLPQSSEFPGNVDPRVFSELPPDVQRELMSEWKQQKLVLKAPSSGKPGRSLVTKDRKAAGKVSQTNNLFKYFKPS